MNNQYFVIHTCKERVLQRDGSLKECGEKSIKDNDYHIHCKFSKYGCSFIERNKDEKHVCNYEILEPIFNRLMKIFDEQKEHIDELDSEVTNLNYK